MFLSQGKRKLFSKKFQTFLFGLLMALAKLLEACNFIKKRLLHRCFPVNFAKFSRSLILEKICGWLLLYCAEFAKSQQQKTKTEWRQRQYEAILLAYARKFFCPQLYKFLFTFACNSKKNCDSLVCSFFSFSRCCF